MPTPEAYGIHWRVIPLEGKLSPGEAVGVIEGRATDLFAGVIKPKKVHRHFRPLHVTHSARGIPRLRGFLLDPDSDLSYFGGKYYFGVTAPDSNRTLYVEQHYPYPPAKAREEVIVVNFEHPDDSYGFRWGQDGLPVEIEQDQALIRVIHSLGRAASAHITDDYDGPYALIADHTFSHPDLQGHRLLHELI